MILTFAFGRLWMKRWKLEWDERAALVVFTVNLICAWNRLTDMCFWQTFGWQEPFKVFLSAVSPAALFQISNVCKNKNQQSCFF